MNDAALIRPTVLLLLFFLLILKKRRERQREEECHSDFGHNDPHPIFIVSLVIQFQVHGEKNPDWIISNVASLSTNKSFFKENDVFLSFPLRRDFPFVFLLNCGHVFLFDDHYRKIFCAFVRRKIN